MCCVGIKSRTRGVLSGSVSEGERLQQVIWNIYTWALSCFLGLILYISLCVSMCVVVCVHTEGKKGGELWYLLIVTAVQHYIVAMFP